MIYAISAPDCIPLVVLKGRVGYISTSLFCMSKRQHIWNKEKCFLFHKSFLLLRKPNFRIIDIQVSWCHRQTRFRLKKTCKNDGSVLEEKPSFKMLWLPLSSKLDWSSCIIPIAKTSSKKIGAFTCFMKFVSPKVALYLYKSMMQPCMEYCCHIWANAPIYYLELLDQLQEEICRTIGPSLAAYFEPLVHCWYRASLSLFYRYYFGRCSSELAQMVPLPDS